MEEGVEKETRGSEELTIKLRGAVLERILEERAKREREAKRAISIAEVVREILTGR